MWYIPERSIILGDSSNYVRLQGVVCQKNLRLCEWIGRHLDMKGSIKMEDYDGFQWIKQHRTKILPLRWISNGCEFIGSYHLIKALRLDHVGNFGFANKYHSFMSDLFYKPYFRWGTVYELLTDIDSVES